jgi:diguanylate cyclase (GGDEF)-like protein
VDGNAAANVPFEGFARRDRARRLIRALTKSPVYKVTPADYRQRIVSTVLDLFDSTPGLVGVLLVTVDPEVTAGIAAPFADSLPVRLATARLEELVRRALTSGRQGSTVLERLAANNRGQEWPSFAEVVDGPLDLAMAADLSRDLRIRGWLAQPLAADDELAGVLVFLLGTPLETLTGVDQVVAADLDEAGVGVTIANVREYWRARERESVDPTTHLPLGNFFERLLAREIELARSGGVAPPAILIADADEFRQFNNRHLDHRIGDQVLSTMVDAIKSALRTTDVMARYRPGDEFGVVLPATDLAQARAVAEQARAAVEGITTVKLVGNGTLAVRVTMSFGVSAWQPGLDAADLITAAEAALYRAKAAGANCVWSD